jgi:adenine phosphoribosyltransferase
VALDRLRASLAEAPVVQFGEYPYFVHPITDGIPLGRPEVLEEVVEEIVRVGRWAKCDKIVTAESMGFPLAAAVSLRVRKPYVFFRKRQYGLPGEVSVAQVTGYGKANLFINNVHRDDRLVFVDDVVSTGGTLRAVVRALRHMGAELLEVIVVFEKTREKEALERELGVRIRTLLKVDIVEGRLVERT